MKKLILFLLLLPFMAVAQVSTGMEQEFDYGIKNNSSQQITTPDTLVTRGEDGTYGHVLSVMNQNAQTGVTSFYGLAVNADPTKYDIGAGVGYISNPQTGEVKKITWSEQTAQTTPYLSTSVATYVLKDDTGATVMQNSYPTPAQFRTHIYLGKLAHTTFTTILFAVTEPNRAYHVAGDLHDLVNTFGSLNRSGNTITPNGANLQINVSAGETYREGANFTANTNSPNITSEPAVNATSFRNKFRNGSGGWNAVNTTTVDPNYYDNGSGILQLVPNNKWTIKVVYRFGGTGTIHMDYGQAVYDNLTAADAGISNSVSSDPDTKNFASRIGWILIQQGTTSLLDATKYKFVPADKIGERAASATGTTTMQGAYNNSVTPQITTNTTGGALAVKRGSAADTDNILVGQNGAGTNTFAVTGAGNITGGTYNNYNPQPIFNQKVRDIANKTGVFAIIGDSFTVGSGATSESTRFANIVQRSLLNSTEGYGYGSNINMAYAGLTTTGAYVTQGVAGSRLELEAGETITITGILARYYDVIYDADLSTGSLEFRLNDNLLFTKTVSGTGLQTTFPTAIGGANTPVLPSDTVTITATGGTVIVTSVETLKQANDTPKSYIIGRSGTGYQDYVTSGNLDEIAYYLNSRSGVKTVVLALGTNNIYNAGKALTPTQLTDNITLLINGINSRCGLSDYLITVPAKSNEAVYPVILGGYTYQDYVNTIFNYCQTNGYQAVRYDQTQLGTGSTTYLADDIHPNDLGHRILANKVNEALGIDTKYKINNYEPTFIKGTTNQVIASGSINEVTLSLPQSIATTSTPTFANIITSNGTASNHAVNKSQLDLKQDALSGGVNGRVAFWTGTNTFSSNSGFLWDNSTGLFGVGIAPALGKIHISGAVGTTRTSAVFTDALNSTFRIGHSTGNLVNIGGNTGHGLTFGNFANDNSTFTERIRLHPSGGLSVGNTIDPGVGVISATSYTGGATLTGTPTAPTPTTGTGIANKDYVDSAVSAAAEPYLVYTALISQSGTSAPTATVLRNTTGGTVSYVYNSTGNYSANISGASYTLNKTIMKLDLGPVNPFYSFRASRLNSGSATLQTWNDSDTAADSLMSGSVLEIRIYP